MRDEAIRLSRKATPIRRGATLSACVRLALLLLLLGIGAQAAAQFPAHRQLLPSDGLASPTVYDVKQDRNGYMWFATESGVSRFDGMSFENYTVQDGLSGNDVLNLFQDSRGRLWVAPFNEKLSYFQNGVIHNTKTDPWLGGIKTRNLITSFIEDKNGVLWFTDDMDRTSKVMFETVINVDSISMRDSTSAFRGVYLNAKGEAMALSYRGLRRLGEERIRTPLRDSVNKWQPPRLITVGKDTHLLAITSRMIWIRGEEVMPLYVHDSLFGDEPLSMDYDAAGNIWIGTRNGVLRIQGYDIVDSTFVPRQMTRILQGHAISSVLQDHEGNYWMTSLDAGVFFFPSVSATTYHYQGDRLHQFASRVFIDPQGRIWVGFDGSVVAQLEHGRLQGYHGIYGTGGRGRCNTLMNDAAGNLWAVMDACIMAIEPNGQAHYWPRGAKSGMIARDGEFYFGHGYVGDCMGKATIAEFGRQFNLMAAQKKVLVGKRTLSFLETHTGQVLMGTVDGLWLRDGAEVRKVVSVPSHSIASIEETADGIIWVASLAQGVGYLYQDRFVPITRAQGLADDICNDIHIDERGIVFVATKRGISRIEVLDYAHQQFRIRNFGANFGLASDEVRGVAAHGGNIYAATAGGLTVLQENYLTATPPRVPVRIEAVVVDGVPLPLDGRPIRLSHRQNHFSLRYSGISFRNSDKLQFAYSLGTEKEEGTWTRSASRQLEFTSLAPGRYHLRIGAVIDGLPATFGEAVLRFEVVPAFWQTGWFLFGVIVLAMVVVALIFLLALRRLRMQERRKAEINKRIATSEQKALRSQMNPHFIFNSLNSIEKFFITGRPQEANAFIADFSDLIRSILDLSAKSAISLQEELRFVELFLTLESHRMDHRFVFQVEVDPSLNMEALEVPPMLLQPFAENAVWHGISPSDRKDGRITLRVAGAHKGFTISVQDNGIGRQRSEELKSKYRPKHKSSGIRITEERLDLLNLDLPGPERFYIEVEDLLNPDGSAAGTRVTLFIPLTFSEEQS